MANAGPAASDALYKYVECLQLHANKMKKTLSWEESQSGPPHDTLFKSSAKLDNTIYPEAQGKTKKKARQNAAKNACDALNILTALSELSFDSTSRTPSPAGMENYISKLNEYGQKNILLIQYNYKHIDTGMDHIQKFSSHVIIGNKTYPDGFGGSKQEAKREAARLAYEEIQEHSSPFKNLEKSPLDVRNEEDPEGDAEGSLAQNPKRLAGDQTTSKKEISDLSSSADVAGNSIDFQFHNGFLDAK
ncbi:interferon-induced, double-stranded RNA-activated protein kinase-like [Pristis pectinata]|uniref:interferon-induced, double-stranded RNA-activated protein kinase-like n=1 Tax=Pristis pectinata TaxID=685728 RepID=UPI00223DCBCD|nr:interferon-induced, double-stranded RNA-activated protein kinase-like [Pristis pectinata]